MSSLRASFASPLFLGCSRGGSLCRVLALLVFCSILPSVYAQTPSWWDEGGQFLRAHQDDPLPDLGIPGGSEYGHSAIIGYSSQLYLNDGGLISYYYSGSLVVLEETPVPPPDPSPESTVVGGVDTGLSKVYRLTACFGEDSAGKPALTGVLAVGEDSNGRGAVAFAACSQVTNLASLSFHAACDPLVGDRFLAAGMASGDLYLLTASSRSIRVLRDLNTDLYWEDQSVAPLVFTDLDRRFVGISSFGSFQGVATIQRRVPILLDEQVFLQVGVNLASSSLELIETPVSFSGYAPGRGGHSYVAGQEVVRVFAFPGMFVGLSEYFGSRAIGKGTVPSDRRYVDLNLKRPLVEGEIVQLSASNDQGTWSSMPISVGAKSFMIFDSWPVDVRAGAMVKIRGFGLDGCASVSLETDSGNSQAVLFSVESDTEVICKIPEIPNGDNSVSCALIFSIASGSSEVVLSKKLVVQPDQ